MKRVFLLGIIIIFPYNFLYGEHQVGLYLAPSYSRMPLNNFETQYNNFSITAGALYRYNQFIKNHFLSFGLGLGGGVVFSKLENSVELFDYNSLLELDAGISYGYAFGKEQEHQVTFFGASLLPRFYGLLERNDYTEIGDTEIEWYEGFYMPLSVGANLPSYRYVRNNFFVGFTHQVTFLVYGHNNINVPNENLILKGIGYQLKFEIGFSLNRSRKYGNTIIETSLSIKTNGNTITLSFVGEMDDAELATIEMFAVKNSNGTEISWSKNMVGYGANLPVFNGRVQYTRHWKNNKTFFDEDLGYEAKYIVVRYKEVDNKGSVLSEREFIKSLGKPDE